MLKLGLPVRCAMLVAFGIIAVIIFISLCAVNEHG
jgi:hypothetical protein